MKLLIVESPTKAKHIKHMLKGFEVIASYGHICDIPLKGEKAFVRPPDFKIHYEISEGKKEQVARLRRAVESCEKDGIYLATDPDREGEAIAMHLARELKIKNPKRVTYNEITESAIKKAIDDPRRIDDPLCQAQEARRALDRMIGWEISPVLSKSVGENASAGRVQSPTLVMVVEREEEIRKFVSVNHFGVTAFFPGEGKSSWKAAWETGVDYFKDESYAKKLSLSVPSLPFEVVLFDRSIRKQAPQSPFTTADMQKEGSRHLRMGVDEIMKLAQSLFEQGLITYHRTDSRNLSSEGEDLLREEAKKRKYPLSEKRRKWPSKEGAQEAHEAIRPTETSIGNERSGSDEKEQKLFNLIWNRAMASQLADAEYDATKVEMKTSFEGKPLVFKGRGSRLVSPGWKVAYGFEEEETEEKENEASNPIPVLKKGDRPVATEGKAEAKKTNPPGRYTQAKLIDALEKSGIGRPSTYATIISNILSRKYVLEGKDKTLSPTKLGESIVNALRGRFHFAEKNYTKNIEENLDRIATGKMAYRDILLEVWKDLQENLKRIPTTDHVCPKCGTRNLFRFKSRKTGEYGWACPGYKDEANPCKTFLSDKGGKPGDEQGSSDHVCPKCGTRNLFRFKSRKTGEYGWACSGYKDEANPCKTFLSDKGGKPGDMQESRKKSDTPCPLCGRDVSLFQGKKGPFWGCSGYKDEANPCDAIFRDNNGEMGDRIVPAPRETTNIACPKCKKTKLVKMTTKTGKPFFKCPENKDHGPWWADDSGNGLGNAWDFGSSGKRTGGGSKKSSVGKGRH